MHWSFFGRITDPQDPFAALNWYNAIGAVGCILWMIAYGFFIYQGRKDKTYGVPMVAICLNITWEGVTAANPCPVPLWRYIEFIWFAIDAVILWELLTLGRRTMLPPPLQKYHYLVVAAMLAMATGFHLTWLTFWDDTILFIDAFLINMVMSILFITMFFSRPTQAGLSIPGAWLKMFGTMLTGVQGIVFLPKLMTAHHDWSFLYFLIAVIALADATYVWLLYHGRRMAREAAAAA